MAYSKETTIDAPPEKVFAYVSDLEKHGEWGTHDNSVKRRDDSPIALGKVYDSVVLRCWPMIATDSSPTKGGRPQTIS